MSHLIKEQRYIIFAMEQYGNAGLRYEKWVNQFHKSKACFAEMKRRNKKLKSLFIFMELHSVTIISKYSEIFRRTIDFTFVAW